MRRLLDVLGPDDVQQPLTPSTAATLDLVEG
jgi:hypothetical protein